MRALRRLAMLCLAVFLTVACGSGTPSSRIGKGGDVTPAAEPFSGPAVGNSGLNCPGRDSVEWKKAEKGAETISSNRSEPLLVVDQRATVHIKPKTVVSGTIRVCGDNATLIVEGRFDGQALVWGSSVRLILTEESSGSGTVGVGGAGTGVIRCYKGEMPSPAPSRTLPCRGLV